MLEVYFNGVICLVNELALRTMSGHLPIHRTSLLTVLLFQTPCLRIQHFELVKAKYHPIVAKLSFVDADVVKFFVLENEIAWVVGLAPDHGSESRERSTLESANAQLQICMLSVVNFAVYPKSVK